MSNSISAFQFEGYRIQKSLIEISETGDDNINIDFELSGQIFKDKQMYFLTLTTIVNNDSKSININVVSVGKFSFGKDVPIDLGNISSLFYTNAPAILFPYVRAYVSTLTNLSGIKPITIPTLNLSELGKTLKDKTTVE